MFVMTSNCRPMHVDCVNVIVTCSSVLRICGLRVIILGFLFFKYKGIITHCTTLRNHLGLQYTLEAAAHTKLIGHLIDRRKKHMYNQYQKLIM